PSTVTLAGGEMLFVPHSGKDDLLTFAYRHDLRFERRRSIWGALLSPFLDTWEDQEAIDREFAWLASSGLDRNAVDAWRREVGIGMIAYTFGAALWEWGGFTFYEVLMAQRARLSRAAFADFYIRAQRVAAADPPLDDVVLADATRIDSALSS